MGEGLRQRALEDMGIWRQRAPAGDPLHAEARHWAAPRSLLISEPTSAGGLGMTPEAWLLNAGVAAVGHMCRTSTLPDGALRHEWRRGYEVARGAPTGGYRHTGRRQLHGTGAAAAKAGSGGSDTGTAGVCAGAAAEAYPPWR